MPPTLTHGNVLAAAIIAMAGLALVFVVLVNVIRWSQAHILETAVKHMDKAAATATRQSQETARAHQERERERVATQAMIHRTAFEEQSTSLATNQLAADQREAAWKRFYQPSAACSNPDTRPIVECANEHIRAKRAFEQRYKISTP